jgi:multisubunit Na+/H+ antiporter MnhB subunit
VIWITLSGAVLAASALVFLLLCNRHKTLREEERELREYFRRKDAAEARGEHYPL